MSAFDKQEGGDHYKHLAIQPAEYCQRNKLGAMESFVVKYVSRHREKNGAADLRKAIHCLELLLEMEYPADAIKALDKGQNVPRGTSEDWDAGEKRMEAIGQNGNTGEHYWFAANPNKRPDVGPFDVIQVMWHDGTYSVMLPHEFGKIAEWSEVGLYRVIRDGTSPDEFPLPSPVRQWDGSRYGAANQKICEACRKDATSGHTPVFPEGGCPRHSGPNLTPHAGGHQHTINAGGHTHYEGFGYTQAQPPYSHTSGVGTLAGIASAVSGINAAVSGIKASS